ncbi:echinoderm microtubule-associated protein-like 4 isoform X1 [Clupea harengus]|uniref:Echinoderm microtubule-associated protein-like 4 isoform X1 n=1 Tax=Clupea harengus TaxID=7950 RepID=A0A8M1KPJ1_CLUHA|nr:echinoderm microtubule-associated protein-like 4 isoform X1 [Clupea harengus]
MTDTHMEELVEQARAMATGEPEGARYHGDALLAPDTDFMTDDRSSAASGLDVSERLTYLEQRVQMQEDELQLLKMALADVLKRLNISEEQQANKKAPAKATRPASLALPPRPSLTSSAAPARKSISSTPPSTASSRNYTPSTATKRSPVVSAKDPPGTPSKARSSTTTTSVTCKKQDRKPGASVAGTRRVTHCKVTMQIYLSRLSRRTGSSESVTPTSVPSNHTEPPPAKSPPPRVTDACDRTKLAPLPSPRQSPAFPLPLHKAPCHSVTSFVASFSPLDASSYRSSIRSPSQYFQICY